MAPVSGSTSLLGFIQAPRPAIVRPYWNWARDARSAIARRLSGDPATYTPPSPSSTRSFTATSSSSDASCRTASRASMAAALTALPTRWVARDGERAHVVGAGVGVGGLDDDLVVRDAERLGRDLGHHRPQPLAEVRGGEDHVERPARGGVDQGLGRVAAQVHAGGVVDGRHAGAAQLRHGQRPPSWPVGRLGPASRGADVIAARSGASSWPTSAAAACIVSISVASAVAFRCGLMSPLRWALRKRTVHGSRPHSLRDLVHLDLDREVAHRHAEPAHRRRRRAVGVDAVARRPRRSGSCTGRPRWRRTW